MLKEAIFNNGRQEAGKSTGREVAEDFCIIAAIFGTLVTYGQNKEKINSWGRKLFSNTSMPKSVDS